MLLLSAAMIPINLNWVSHLIDVAINNGNPPGELHMSQKTQESFIACLKMIGQKPPAVRWRGEVRVEQPWKFRDIPIVVNADVPDGDLLMRPANRLNDATWHEQAIAMMENVRKRLCSGQPPAQNAPPATQDDSGSVYASEAMGEGTETVSDVLMTSLTRCDDVDAVIVIMAKDHGREIEVRSNLERFTSLGLFQAAWQRVSQGD